MNPNPNPDPNPYPNPNQHMKLKMTTQGKGNRREEEKRRILNNNLNTRQQSQDTRQVGRGKRWVGEIGQGRTGWGLGRGPAHAGGKKNLTLNPYPNHKSNPNPKSNLKA